MDLQYYTTRDRDRFLNRPKLCSFCYFGIAGGDPISYPINHAAAYFDTNPYVASVRVILNCYFKKVSCSYVEYVAALLPVLLITQLKGQYTTGSDVMADGDGDA